MSIDAMKQALAAIEAMLESINSPSLRQIPFDKNVQAMVALRAAIEQAQEPVAWLVQYPNKHEFVWGERPQWIAGAIGIEPLYTATLQWQGLTDEEIAEIAATPAAMPGRYVHSFARAIEAKLKEKNT